MLRRNVPLLNERTRQGHLCVHLPFVARVPRPEVRGSDNERNTMKDMTPLPPKLYIGTEVLALIIHTWSNRVDTATLSRTPVLVLYCSHCSFLFFSFSAVLRFLQRIWNFLNLSLAQPYWGAARLPLIYFKSTALTIQNWRGDVRFKAEITSSQYFSSTRLSWRSSFAYNTAPNFFVAIVKACILYKATSVETGCRYYYDVLIL